MSNSNSTYITRTRNAVTRLIDALDELHALDRQRSALDLGNTINNGTRNVEDIPSVQFGDFSSENTDITLSDINAVTTSLSAIDALMASGHGTNLYRVKK